MSVQLIVYPQNYEGLTNSTNIANAVLVDGINFSTVNASTSFFVGQPNGVQEAINFYNPTLPVNTWKRYKVGSSGVSESGGNLTISVLPSTNQQGILQKLSNLTVGAVYNIEIDCTLLVNGIFFNLSIFSGTVLQSSHPFPLSVLSNTIISFQFTANSTEDTIVIGANTSTNGLINISNISITTAPTQPSGAIQILGDGQVILDLYEDEDLPLTLSVDNFKNVAEKVQSYSKAFNLPATKRNNKIFDHIFEVTRELEVGSLLFNPYKETKCVLKQDGFILFEGYLRMLNITDKEGEISYDVNLYSEVIALADILQERTFRDLGFEELTHDYNKTNIKRSWNDTGNSIAYTNPSTSGFRDAYTTLRYPFVDWNHQFLQAQTGGNPIAGNPELSFLETAFRPFINIKYIIDRIFEATDFTYESSFFNEADFKKLYMDFNWGSNKFGTEVTSGTYAEGNSSPDVFSDTSFTALPLDNITFDVAMGWDSVNYRFIATANNQAYVLEVPAFFGVILLSGQILSRRWAHYNSSNVLINTFNVVDEPFGTGFFGPLTSPSTTMILNAGDYLQYEWKTTSALGALLSSNAGSGLLVIIGTTGDLKMTTNTLLQTLRGELGQWDFLKGLITMFNLVTLPDEDNPNNIKIEPYADVFINSDDSVQLNWTEKIDVSQMKLTPLTDLNKKTMFKFVEDDDDSAFMQYKNQVGGHLYGSKLFTVSNEFNILDGEEEIIAEPFAATVVKPLMDIFPQFITPAIYAMNDDGITEGFENSPRIMYNNGIKPTGASYSIPAQNGVVGSAAETNFLQFSHLSEIPTSNATPSSTLDFHFGICQLFPGVGDPTTENLFNLYWLPYLSELYNPNTRTMTIKVNLSPADINTFKFNDTVFIKNRIFRVNKIDYKPNDLATVEFILIP